MGSTHPGFLTQYGSDAPDAHTPHYGDASSHQGTVFQITKDLTVTQEGLQIGQSKGSHAQIILRHLIYIEPCKQG